MLDYLTTRRGSSSPLPLPKRLTEEHYQELLGRPDGTQRTSSEEHASVVPDTDMVVWNARRNTVQPRPVEGQSRHVAVGRLPREDNKQGRLHDGHGNGIEHDANSSTRCCGFFHIRNDEAVYVRYCDIYVQDNSEDIEKQRLLKEKARQQRRSPETMMTFHDLMNRKPFRRKKQPVPVEATAPAEFADIALKKMIV